MSAGSIVPGAHAAPGTATLLLDGAPAQDVPRGSLDVQVCFGPARLRTSPTRAVVLCTRAADPDADELSLRLAARSVPLVRIDADRDDDDDLAWDGDHVTIERGGRTYLPRVLWTRLFAPAGRADDALNAAAAQHAREQTAARAANLGALPGTLTINPGDLTSRVPALVAALGLQVAAVDLLDTGDDVVFLEANASGSWRWFEHRTGTAAVSEAITAWVADRYAAAA